MNSENTLNPTVAKIRLSRLIVLHAKSCLTVNVIRGKSVKRKSSELLRNQKAHNLYRFIMNKIKLHRSHYLKSWNHISRLKCLSEWLTKRFMTSIRIFMEIASMSYLICSFRAVIFLTGFSSNIWTCSFPQDKFGKNPVSAT